MFMFWGKRTSYTKRLLKAKVRGEHETECEAQENLHNTAPNSNSRLSNNTSRSPSAASSCYALGGGEDSSEEDTNRVTRCKELLKSLKENQLEMLLAAVESYGANLGACVMVKRRRPESESESDVESLSDADNYHSRITEDDDYGECGRRDTLKITSNTTTTSLDRNPHCYPHHHRHHHHHHHHHSKNHNRRLQRHQNLNNDNYRESKKLRGADYLEENISLEERINSNTTNTATTTTNAGRRSRTSGNGGNDFPVDPHLLCCQIWRWPDLNNCSELKRLPVCHSAKDPVDICCNPYHWSRLCKPESPPPPYCLIADRLRPEDRAPSEGDNTQYRYNRNTNSPPLPGSLTTNGEDVSGQREWCTLAYWELGGRVGRLYPVEPSSVNVFDSLLDGDGLCLSTLAENHPTSPSIQRTRSKIGLGLTLSQESDGVWAYNRSDNPIFVNSPTLDDPESRTLLVYRVPPGFCLNIFDRAKTFQQQQSSYSPSLSSPGGSPPGPGFASGPVDVNSVRISFAKGWGPKYSRQEVTSCPCWLEVLLAPCR